MKKCIKCNCDLNDKNWLKSRIEKNHYICKECFNSKVKLTSRYKNARTTDIVKKTFDSILSRKISNFMQDAKKRNKTLDFNYNEIGEIMKKPCSYCGTNEAYSGLDRIDSKYGYTKTNVVPCCAVCNRAKNTLEVDVFINHCKKIVNFFGGI